MNPNSDHQSEQTSSHASESKEPWQQYLEENVSDVQQKHMYVDPTDGTRYEWDDEKRAWFPSLDDDLISAYSSQYNYDPESDVLQSLNKNTSNEQSNEQPLEVHPEEKKMKRKSEDNPNESRAEKIKRLKKEATWFDIDPEKNTSIYISGLPSNITDEEFLELVSKYGILAENIETKTPKFKLYKNANGSLKGDGLCTYLKRESVDLAIKLLDESDFNGKTIRVQLAKFELKGQYNPNLKPKSKNKKKKEKEKKEKLLDWVDRDIHKPKKQDRIVVVENYFDQNLFEKDPALINDIRAEFRKSVSNYGEIRKVIVFDKNPRGICSVAFTTVPEAQYCIQMMNGRIHCGRKLNAHLWDGVTNYDVRETEKDVEKRDHQWEEFLLQD